MAEKYQDSKRYIPSLEVGEYEQYKKKQTKKGGWSLSLFFAAYKFPVSMWGHFRERFREDRLDLVSCDNCKMNCVARSLPPGRGGTVRPPTLRPAATPARLQEEREEAEGVRQLRCQPRLWGSRGETEPSDGAGQTGLLLHQELPLTRPRPGQAEVQLLQTSLALSPVWRLPRQGRLERFPQVHPVSGQILPSFQQLQKDFEMFPQRLDVSQQDNVRLPRASSLPPAAEGEETREEVGAEREYRLGLHQLQQLHHHQGDGGRQHQVGLLQQVLQWWVLWGLGTELLLQQQFIQQ